jgi:hypothetical protein
VIGEQRSYGAKIMSGRYMSQKEDNTRKSLFLGGLGHILANRVLTYLI